MAAHLPVLPNPEGHAGCHGAATTSDLYLCPAVPVACSEFERSLGKEPGLRKAMPLAGDCRKGTLLSASPWLSRSRGRLQGQ